MKIILDINTIPFDYKERKSTKEIVDSYKEDFGVDIIPIDLSKQNIKDSESSFSPYIIKDGLNTLEEEIKEFFLCKREHFEEFITKKNNNEQIYKTKKSRHS